MGIGCVFRERKKETARILLKDRAVILLTGMLVLKRLLLTITAPAFKSTLYAQKNILIFTCLFMPHVFVKDCLLCAIHYATFW